MWSNTNPPLYGEIQGSRGIKFTTDTASQAVEILVKLNPNDLVSANAGTTYLGVSDDSKVVEYISTFIPRFKFLSIPAGGTVILVLTGLDIDEISKHQWLVKAKYDYNPNRGQGGGGAGGSVGGGGPAAATLDYIKIGFTIGGGSKVVKRSEEVLNSVLRIGSDLPGIPESATLPFIAATEDGEIQGTEVPSNSLRLQITGFYFPHIIDLDFTETIRNIIAGSRNTGSYNDDTFLDYEAGEVSLIQVTGGGSLGEIIPLTFEFDIKRNISNAVDPAGFPPYSMLGHDVLDYRFVQAIDDNAEFPFSFPEIRLIHRVRTPEDYSQLLLPV